MFDKLKKALGVDEEEEAEENPADLKAAGQRL